jgi:Cu+-exporting ATPase
MHCVGCAMTIEGALEDLDGVKSVSVNYAKQSAEIEYDDKTVNQKHLIAAIQKAGYSVA